MLGRKDLRVYQVFFTGKIKQCLAIIDRIPGILLALEPGAGKTVIVLTASQELLDEDLIARVLIVAPLLVAQTVWPAEMEDWEHLQGLTWTLIRVEDDDPDLAEAGRRAYDAALQRYRAFFAADFALSTKLTQKVFGALSVRMAEGHRQRGQAAEKLRKLALLASQDTQIHIINKEALDWLWGHMGEGQNVPYDLLVLDDLREGRSGRKRAKRDEANRKNAPLSRFGILARMRKHVKATIQLTGTPTPSGLHNLWGLTYLIDLGRRLGTAQTAFNKKYFELTEFWKPGRPLEGAFDAIMGKVKDIMFSLDPRDYPELPPFIIDPIRVRLPEAVKAEYNRFRRNLVSEEYDVEAVSSGALHNKLLQFCISRDVPVLTDRGWVLIQDVTAQDCVWDGVDWVACSGVAHKGLRSVVECFGVKMTLEHKVLTTRGWVAAQDVLNGNASEGFERSEVRLPDGYSARGVDELKGNMAGRVCVRQATDTPEPEPSQSTSRGDEILRLPSWGNGVQRQGWSHDDRQSPLGDMATDEESLSQFEVEGLPQLRWPRHRHAGLLVSVLQGFLGRCAGRLCGRFDNRSTKQQQELQQAQFSLGHSEGAVAKYAGQPDRQHTLGKDDRGRGCRTRRTELSDSLSEGGSRIYRCDAGGSADEVEVFDLVDCGPRHRFVVLGADGPLIVHNCNGSMYQEDGNDVWIHDVKIEALHLLLERMNGAPLLVAYTYQFDAERIMAKFPQAVLLRPENAVDSVRRWNRDEIPLLLAHRASAGHGLNMQKGTGHMCEYGLTSDAELYLQFVKRICRPGRETKVFNHVIIAEGTIDDDIFPRYLDPKIAMQLRIMRETQVTFGDHPETPSGWTDADLDALL